MRFLLTTILSFLIISNLYSQTLEPIITDRPDQSESAFVVPAGSFQSEIGFTFEKHVPDGDVSISSVYAPSILFRYGLLPGAELRAEVEYRSIKTNELRDNGLGPLTLGTKIKICKTKGLRPETAFIFHLTIANTGTEIFQTPHTAPSFRFTMQNEVSKKFSLSYNLGQEWDGFSPKPVSIYTLSLAYSAAEKIGLYIESYGFLVKGERPDHRLDGGATYLIKNNIQADISAGMGLTTASPDFFLSAGISFRIPE